MHMGRSRFTAGSAAAVCLLAGCSLQDFDSLSSGLTGGNGGTGGSGGTSGGSGTGGTGGLDGDASSGETGGSGGTTAGAGGSGQPQAGNLISDPSFEAGHTSWTGFGRSTILDVSTGARTGQKCIASGNRTESWEGPSYDAIVVAQPTKSYQMEAWLRLDVGAAQQTVNLSLKAACVGVEPTYTPLSSIVASPEWTAVRGAFTVPDCTLQELRPYFEGPTPETVVYLDDVSLVFVP
jgi:hypothetical protein